MNYKIRVENEAESKDCQGLFFELGASLGNGDKHAVLVPNIMGLAVIDGLINFVFNGVVFKDIKQCEEITIQQLKDLVVLKRNDVGDHTHGSSFGSKFYYCCNGDVYAFSDGAWVFDHTKVLKPIEKKEMKEYLEPMANGDYRYHKDEGVMIGGDWIEIPDGSEVAVYYKYKDKVFFWKDAGKTHWGESSRLQLGWYDCSANMFAGLDGFLSEWADQATVIWKRETLSDQVASAETARQSDRVLKEILEGDLPEFELNIEQDNVNQPVHYCSHPSGIECIEITRHHDFAIGNAIKYLWRAGLKDSSNEIQDLEKSIWYIQDKINQLKKQNANSCKD